MFGLGPLWVVLIGPRLVTPGMHPRLRRSVLGTDLALAVLIGGLAWLVGWQELLLVLAPPLLLTGAAGIWLFYVQHQFEDAYWQRNDEWSFDEAALQGSSYLRLPRILQFFTGNIGLHHVHHLSARIPNYNLQAAHDAGDLGPVPTLSLRDGLARRPAEALGRRAAPARHLPRSRPEGVSRERLTHLAATVAVTVALRRPGDSASRSSCTQAFRGSCISNAFQQGRNTLVSVV